MPFPTIVIVKNSGLGDTPLFDFPLKNGILPTENLGRKSSTIVTEITDTEDAVYGEESTIPPGCLPKGNEESIDLSQRNLQSFPVKVFAICKHLKFLFLQENSLQSLPEELFTTFPLLRRLDVRKNELTSIPANIGDHTALEVLLLQDNYITTLPPHLGHCQTLRNLQLQGNPLIWPQESIVSQGVKKILAFLRENDKSSDAVQENTRSNHDEQKRQEECTSFDRGDPWTRIENKPSRQGSAFIKPTGMNTKGDEESKASYSKGPNSTPTKKSNSRISLIRRKSSASFDNEDQATLVSRRGEFPLGYHKRVSNVPQNKVYETLRRELWKDAVRQEMLIQNYLLQKQRDSETLRGWRQKTKVMQLLRKPKRTPTIVPFDQDENLQMMTWKELLHARNKSLENKGHSKPAILARRAPDPSEGILKLLQDIDKLRADCKAISTQPDETSQYHYRMNLNTQINKLRELQKALRSIRIIS